MVIYKVIRPNGIVLVSILKNKDNHTYSYVNITKGHICSCKFKSYKEALEDMDRLIKQGKIIDYCKLNDIIIKEPAPI